MAYDADNAPASNAKVPNTWTYTFTTHHTCSFLCAFLSTSKNIFKKLAVYDNHTVRVCVSISGSEPAD
jgi:hypothetical protein